MDLTTGFASELSWKIFLDRYTVKEPERQFQPGDLAIALVEPHPKWPKKDIGVVRELVAGDRLTIELVTGPQKGDVIERRRGECDRPLERSIDEVARRIARGVAQVEAENVRADVEESFAREIAALRFVPGGRIWAGAGTGQNLTYFNCVAKETLIHTQAGLRRIDALSGPVSILTQGGVYRTAVFNSYGIQRLYRVGLENGDVLYATRGHEWVVTLAGGQTETVTTMELPGRAIPVVTPQKPAMDPEAIAHGIVYGLSRTGSARTGSALALSGELRELLPYVKPYGRVVSETPKALIVSGLPQAFDTLPAQQAGPGYWRGFLVGWIAAAGDFEEDVVTLSHSDASTLETVRRHVSEAGFVATEVRALSRAVNAGGVQPIGNIGLYRSTVVPDDGLLARHRSRLMRRPKAPATARVVSVEETDRVEEVFCCHEPQTHTMVVGQGYLTRQCYVIPSPKDSRQGIVETLGQMIEIMSRGGGVGINISSLRPSRAPVRGVNGRSSGAVSWMDLYSRATGLVEQGGSRRGALMLQIEDWHPDIWRFIDVKKTPGMVENANISVRISDRFMQAVKRDAEWELVFPDTADADYDRIWDGDLDRWRELGKPVVVYDRVPARRIWMEMIQGAWEAAEPGVVFSERHETDSNSWYFNRLVCTNPCAEQPLPAWGVCTLGHVNLAAFFDPVTKDVDWDGLKVTVRMGTRFLDDIVDATPYFFEENRENQMRERRIGLGSMGLGELLIRLGLRYGSPESLEFIDRLFRFIAEEAYGYDVELAREKGPFPAFDADKFGKSGFIERLSASLQERIYTHGVRNVTILTQAPTGTVGTMVGTSTGIEPYYALTYYRQSRLGYDEQDVPVAQEWKEDHPGEPLPDYFVGAMDLTPEEHVRVQAAIQRWVDSSISKTANAPAHYTVEDTAQLYELAYELGCKGVTIYRDLSRQEQVLHRRDETPEQDSHPSESVTPEVRIPSVEVYPVPSQIDGHTYRKETPAGTARVVINEVDGDPFEVFLLLGRAGSEVQSFMESLGRVISLYLRSSGDLTARRKLMLVAEQLKGIGGANQMGFGPGRVLSVVDAIGQIIDSHIRSRQTVAEKPHKGGEGLAVAPATRRAADFDLCPQCQAPTLVYEEGCRHCPACGYSKC